MAGVGAFEYNILCARNPILNDLGKKDTQLAFCKHIQAKPLLQLCKLQFINKTKKKLISKVYCRLRPKIGITYIQGVFEPLIDYRSLLQISRNFDHIISRIFAMCSHKSGNFSDTLHMINRSNIFVGRKENIKTVKMIATMNNIGTMFGYLYRKIARPVATHCKKKQKKKQHQTILSKLRPQQRYIIDQWFKNTLY